jgi:hypothetical protein
VITVVHGDDPVPPSVVITKPDTPFRFADQSYDVEYDAHDPDGTGTVKLEAALHGSSEPMIVLAEELPALDKGTFTWNVKDLPRGDYMLRATITDARGMSFSSYGRYFLLVEHFETGTDGGAGGGGGEEEKGCGCSTAKSDRSVLALFVLASALCFIRRRNV